MTTKAPEIPEPVQGGYYPAGTPFPVEFEGEEFVLPRETLQRMLDEAARQAVRS